jgi:hypothetical protein
MKQKNRFWKFKSHGGAHEPIIGKGSYRQALIFLKNINDQSDFFYCEKFIEITNTEEINWHLQRGDYVYLKEFTSTPYFPRYETV